MSCHFMNMVDDSGEGDGMTSDAEGQEQSLSPGSTASIDVASLQSMRNQKVRLLKATADNMNTTLAMCYPSN